MESIFTIIFASASDEQTIVITEATAVMRNFPKGSFRLQRFYCNQRLHFRKNRNFPINRNALVAGRSRIVVVLRSLKEVIKFWFVQKSENLLFLRTFARSGKQFPTLLMSGPTNVELAYTGNCVKSFLSLQQSWPSWDPVRLTPSCDLNKNFS